ncbi:MAG: hypothetical protein FJZ56_01585 [Chlamydiae bacterium]|nr:hypothetical protein [Chlamydiota bacterium]
MRKHDKENLQALLQLPAYVFWKDSQNRFAGCNNAFAEFLGLMPEDIIGKNDREISARLGVNFECEWKEARSCKSHLVDKEGVVHHIIASKRPLYNDHGNIVGSISAFFDR